MGLQLLSSWTGLVYISVQILQLEALQTLLNDCLSGVPCANTSNMVWVCYKINDNADL